MNAAEYHALKAVSASLLKKMQQSPAHAKAFEDGLFEATASQNGGTLKHMLTLEPGRVDSEVAVFTGKVRRGKEFDAFEEKHAGKLIVNETEMAEAQSAARSVRKHPLASKLLAQGEAEVPLLWEAAGLKAKSRIDWLSSEAIVDLKFTKDSSPSGYPREAHRYGLPLQAAFYTDAVKAKTGPELPFFVIACEPGPVFAVTVFRVPMEVIELGRAQYLKALRQWEWCREQGEWPAYSTTEQILQLPAYAFGDYENE